MVSVAHLHISEYSRKVFGHDHRANARVILGGVDTKKSPRLIGEEREPRRVHWTLDAAQRH